MTSNSQQSNKHIWVITGPAGCGKSTVAAHLAEQLSLPFLEGDDYHPPSNVSKMAHGHPLTDLDRWSWLVLLRAACLSSLTASNSPPGVVVTCSALKRSYRDVFRVASTENANVKVHFVYLRASEALSLERVKARAGHYMKEDMVRSQFATLEEPGADEGDCLTVEVGGTMPEVQALALRAVEGALVPVVEEETRG